MDQDFMWLVGLLEGEGSFHFRPKDQCAYISTRMKDKDVVERVALILGVKMYGPYTNPKKPHHSPVYAVFSWGQHAAEWMIKLRPFMGIRRTAQIDDCLSKWLSRKVMSPIERMANARKFRFATKEQHFAQQEQALKIKLGTYVRPN